MIKDLLKWRLFKTTAIAVAVAFLSGIPAQSGFAQTLPVTADMVHATSPFDPTLMMGLRVDPANPFSLAFVMRDGEKVAAAPDREQEYQKLIKYFMASLVTPNRDIWVNLSPKESERIIADDFSMTEMGRDLLAQDYLLKKFTASLMYPEDATGRAFWARIYQKAYEQFGSTDVPVDTFNKVWITADKADIYQKDATAFVVKSHLKVMLEQDLVAAKGDRDELGGIVKGAGAAETGAHKLASDIVREVIVPVIEREVNEGGLFASVRQAYSAMILATWFKKTLKDSLLGQVYADQRKVAGIELNDPDAKERIYQQYLATCKNGVFNYIKEEYDELSQETLPRKYFAGGMVAVANEVINAAQTSQAAARELAGIDPARVGVAAVDLQTVDGKDIRAAVAARPVSAPVVAVNKAAPAKIDADERVVRAKEELAAAEAKVSPAQSSLAAAREELAAAEQVYDRAQKAAGEARAVTSRLSRILKAAGSLRRIALVLGFITMTAGSLFGATVDKQGDVPANATAWVTLSVGAQTGSGIHGGGGVTQETMQVGNVINRVDGSSHVGVIDPDDGFIPVHTGDGFAGHNFQVGTHYQVLMDGDLIKLGDQKDLGSFHGDIHARDGKVITTIVTGLHTEVMPRAIVVDLGADTETGTSGATGPVTAPAVNFTMDLTGMMLTPLSPLADAPVTPAPSVDAHAAAPDAGPLQDLSPDISNVIINDLPGIPGTAVVTPAAPAAPETAAGESTEPPRVIVVDMPAPVKIKNPFLQSQWNKAIAGEAAIQQEIDTLDEALATSRAAVADLKAQLRRDAARPVTSGTATSLSYVRHKIVDLKALATAKVNQGLLPVGVQGAHSYNASPIGKSFPIGKGGASLIVIPKDIPLENVAAIYKYGVGLRTFSSQSALNQATGPLFMAQRLLGARNDAVLDLIIDNGVMWDVNMTPGKAVLQSLTLHVVPFEGFTDDGRKVNDATLTFGLVDNLEALLGTVDWGLGGMGIVGDSNKHYVFENLGFQSQSGTDEERFNYLASVNTDPNLIPFLHYEITDPNTTYTMNAHNGFEVVDSRTLPKGTEVYFKGTAEGDVIEIDAGKGKSRLVQAFKKVTFLTKSFIKEGKTRLSPSITDLQKEEMLINGVAPNGKPAYGGLRDKYGRIVRFITDRRELNALSTITADDGREFQFQPSGPEKKGGFGFAGRYVGRQLTKFWDTWSGRTAGQKYAGSSAKDFTGMNEVPADLKELFKGNALVFSPSGRYDKAVAKGSQGHNLGVFFFNNGQEMAPVTSWEQLHTLAWYVEQAAKSGIENKSITPNKDGKTYTVKGLARPVAADEMGTFANDGTWAVWSPSPYAKLKMLEQEEARGKAQADLKKWRAGFGVVIDIDTGKASECLDPSKFRTAKAAGMTGRTFEKKGPDGTVETVTITDDMQVQTAADADGVEGVKALLLPGLKTNRDYQTVILTLAQGGTKVFNKATGQYETYAADSLLSDPEILSGEARVFAEAQRRANVQSAEKLIDAMRNNQVGMEPDPDNPGGPDRMVWLETPDPLDKNFPSSPAKSMKEFFGKNAYMELPGPDETVTAPDGTVTTKKTVIKQWISTEAPAEPAKDMPPQSSIGKPAGGNAVRGMAAALLALGSSALGAPVDVQPGANVPAAPVAQQVQPVQAARFPTLLDQQGHPVRGLDVDSTFSEKDFGLIKGLGGKLSLKFYHAPPEAFLAKLFAACPNVVSVIIDFPLDDGGYGKQIIPTFFGKPAPAASEIISLESRNHIPYMKAVTGRFPQIKFRWSMANEGNQNYASWKNRQPGPATDQEFFSRMNGYAHEMHEQVPGAEVSTALLNRPDQFTLVYRMTDIDFIEVNVYSDPEEVFTNLQKASEETGIVKPVIFSEFGALNHDPEAQARHFKEQTERLGKEGIGWFYMSFEAKEHKRNNADIKRIGGAAAAANEAGYGIVVKGLPLPTYGEFKNLLATESALPEGASFKVIPAAPAKAATPAGPAVKPVPARVAPAAAPLPAAAPKDIDLNSPAARALKLGAKVQRLSIDGKISNEIVNTLDGAREIPAAALADYWMVLPKDGQSAYFVTLAELKDPVKHDRLRRMSDGPLELRDARQVPVGRLYLDPNIFGSRVELVNGDTSRIFELMSFYPSNPVNPVAKTEARVESRDENGKTVWYRHVVMTDLRPVNKNVVVEDVYKANANGTPLLENKKPVLDHSDRSLQGVQIFFQGGREHYAVSMDPVKNPGVTIEVDGTPVEHVIALYDYDEVSHTGYYIKLGGKNGVFAGIRKTEFNADSQVMVDYPGFVSLDDVALTLKKINERVKERGVYLLQDKYNRDGKNQVTGRDVSLRAPGQAWEAAWTITGGAIAPLSAMEMTSEARLLMAALVQGSPVPAVSAAFEQLGLNMKTPLVESLSTTVQGVTTTTFTILGDVQEKKAVLVREEAGHVIEIIVGLAFDPQTGEQTLAYVLTPGMELKAVRRTVDNEQTLRALLPAGMADVYVAMFKTHFGRDNAVLGADLREIGIDFDMVPTAVKVTPMLPAGESPSTANEARIRDLLKHHHDAITDGEKALVRHEIIKLVRDQRGDRVHYTQVEGQSTIELLRPNDPPGRPIAIKSANGDARLVLWSLGGETVTVVNADMPPVKEPVAISPGSLLVDTTGKVQELSLFSWTGRVPVTDAGGAEVDIQANKYVTMENPLHRSTTFSCGGAVLLEEFDHVLNRVLNGKFGYQIKGVETAVYDPFLAFQAPLYVFLNADNSILQVPLTETFSSSGNDLMIRRVTIERDPTAPEVLDVKVSVSKNGQTLSKDTLDTWGKYGHNFTDNWQLLAAWLASLLGVLLAATGMSRARFAMKKKQLPAEIRRLEARTVRVAPVPTVVTPPTWNSYGFDDGVVANSRRTFEQDVLRRLANGETLESLFEKKFRLYKLWRTAHMGLPDDYEPTMEHLWLSFLVTDGGGMMVNHNVDGKNYLLHKAIAAYEAYKNDPTAAMPDIGGFADKEAQRWATIIELQFTTFQGLAGKEAKNIVPAQYFFGQQDLFDLFRMPEFIAWYDGLDHTIDREPDLRGAIYEDFIAGLRAKVTALVNVLQGDLVFSAGEFAEGGYAAPALIDGIRGLVLDVVPGADDMETLNNVLGQDWPWTLERFRDAFPKSDLEKMAKSLIEKTARGETVSGEEMRRLKRFFLETALPAVCPFALARSVDNKVFRMKRLAPGYSEYGQYLDFFDQVQWGRWTPSENFSFQYPPEEDGSVREVTRAAAVTMIAGKPLILKTFAEAGAENGKAPYVVRGIKPMARIVTNLERPLTPVVMTTLAALACALALKGAVTWGAAVAGFVGAGMVLKALVMAVSALLDRSINTEAFGKPKLPSAGVKPRATTWGEKIYRTSFWTAQTAIKFAWNVFIFYYALIPGSEMLGAHWDVLHMNMNALLVAALALPVTLFSYLDFPAIFDQLTAHTGVLRNKAKGIGVIRTGKDIGKLQKDLVLEDLIDTKLLPKGLGLNKLKRDNARRQIYDFWATNLRSRGLINAAEEEKVRRGIFNEFRNEAVQRKVAAAINSMQMESPDMPHAADAETVGFVIPLYGEDVNIPWDEKGMGMALNIKKNTGRSNLKELVDAYPDYWDNLIERMRLEGKASDEELAQMERIKKESTLLELGDNRVLIDEIRTWAGYRTQPFARTFDGVMNYVRWKQILERISNGERYEQEARAAHPEWTADEVHAGVEEQVRAAVRGQVQFVLAYQIWGDILNAPASDVEKTLKKRDTIALLKKAHDELGFDVEIASLQKRGDIYHRVLSRYDGNNGTEDLMVVPLGKTLPIAGEGKPYNLVNAFKWVWTRRAHSWDMNMDLFCMRAHGISLLNEEFKRHPNAVMINFPEAIDTDGFSPLASYNALAEGTHVSMVKPEQIALGVGIFTGHPDSFDMDFVREVSNATPDVIPEDAGGGDTLQERTGGEVVHVAYAEADKLKETGLIGSMGFEQKLGMGAGDLVGRRMLPRYYKYLGTLRSAAHHFTGSGFFLVQALAVLTLFAYIIGGPVLGISAFTAIPAPALVAFVGMILLGQAIVFKAYFFKFQQMGFWRGSTEFFKMWGPMVPFFLATVFTITAGVLSGIFGLKFYVATGRVLGLDHEKGDRIITNFGKSHILPGAAVSVLSIYALHTWLNATLGLSVPYFLMAALGMSMMFALNRGTLPGKGVTAETFLTLFKEDFKDKMTLIKDTWKKGFARKDKLALCIDLPVYLISTMVWMILTVPVAAVVAPVTKVRQMFTRRPRAASRTAAAVAVAAALGGSDARVEAVETADRAWAQADIELAAARQTVDLRAEDVTVLEQGAAGLKARVDEAERDAAMLAAEVPPAVKPAAVTPVGGISFNENDLAITIRVDGNGMPLAVALQDPALMNIPGLKPVIRSIGPVSADNVPAIFELMGSSTR